VLRKKLLNFENVRWAIEFRYTNCIMLCINQAQHYQPGLETWMIINLTVHQEKNEQRGYEWV